MSKKISKQQFISNQQTSKMIKKLVNQVKHKTLNLGFHCMNFKLKEIKSTAAVIAFIILSLPLAMSQTPFSIVNSSNSAGVAHVSPGNAWGGSKVQYNFNDDAALNSNFLFNMTTLYNIPMDGNFNLPVIGNVSFPFSDDLNEIQVGVFPWGVLNQNESRSIILHGGIEYILTPQDNIDVSRQDVNLSAGFEIAMWLTKNGLPMTCSVTPVYSLRNLELDNVFSLELTGIVPIASGLGFILDAEIPLNSDKTIISAGIIANNVIGL